MDKLVIIALVAVALFLVVAWLELCGYVERIEALEAYTRELESKTDRIYDYVTENMLGGDN